jgi:hypothetical protein
LKAAVEIVRPEYAKILAKARASMEALCKKSPGSGAVAEADVDADMAALRAYRIKPDANVIREFAVLVNVLRDGTQLSRWFFSGDQMQIWIKEDMLSFLKRGGILPDFSLAPDGKGVSWNVPFSLSEKTPDASKLPAVSLVDARANVFRRIDAVPHPEYPEAASRNTAMFDQEQARFMVAHEVTESAMMNTVVKSADRRWFCDGLANWVAMQDVDRRFGPGKGAEAFAKTYAAAELRKHAAKVDLFTWPAAENVKDGSHSEVENPSAYYYFATLVMEKACEGRGADFVKQWLDEVRKTPLNRANAGTALAAYRKLTGKDLKSMIGEVEK